MASPLGLSSDKTNFNRGKAEYTYNKVDKKWQKSTTMQASAYEQSLFNDASQLSYFPRSDASGNITNVPSPHSGDMGYGTNADSVYDVRTQSIIEWSQKQSKSMMLFARDFAYLRNLGVYPNNRLIVCKKFGSGIGNDLSRVDTYPVSTILSWKPAGEEFFKIDFGEEWDKVDDPGFTEILNDIGKEFGSGSGALGTNLSGGLGGVPLPGFTEIFQRKVMMAMGLIDANGANIIPSGSPNLIKDAMRRKTVGDNRVGSGLHCKISIAVKAEYEQKFIGGLDPTKAFYDIMSNISQFGTQDSVFYLNGASGLTFSNFMKNLSDRPRETMERLLKDVITGLSGVVNGMIKSLGGDDSKPGFFASLFSDTPDETKKKDLTANADPLAKKILDETLSLVTGIVKKYEVRILGVVNLLTGNPSGPWHVTIGNPKRPVFTSGDMVVKSVSISLGETLSFNDLPSKITAEFTLENARPLGLSEIMSRFMQGQGRTYISGPSSWSETSSGQDFNVSVVTGTVSTQTSTGAPVGGLANSDSQSDGSKNIGSTVSNSSFAQGSGIESTAENQPDADLVRNVGGITDVTPPPADTLSVATGPNVGPNPIVPVNTTA